MLRSICAAALLVQAASIPGWPGPPPQVLPPAAVTLLARSVEVSKPLKRHVWRDTPPLNPDGTINAYVEIPRGERRKFEFNMRRNMLYIDRVMPLSLGGYPVNYGFVPQTVSYDGDPFDALILGAPLRGGNLTSGAIVGLMHMEDERGVDSKVVLSRLDGDGRPMHALGDEDMRVIGDYFNRYKQHEPGKFSRVPGWDSVQTGKAYVETTHRFFNECRGRPDVACELGVR
jgi:inorganic pyrophosphatase